MLKKFKIQNNQKKTSIKNKKGIVTIPFLLVLIIFLFFILSLLGLAMTLVHVSVSQYMSYSTARKLSLGGESLDGQKETSLKHYQKLRGRFFNSNAHTGKSGDWFTITPNLQNSNLGFVGEDIRNARRRTKYQNMFYGVSLDFSSTIAQFQIPFLVKDKTSAAFPAKIRSFLGREVSQKECEDFNKERAEEICKKYSSLPACKVLVSPGDNAC